MQCKGSTASDTSRPCVCECTPPLVQTSSQLTVGAVATSSLCSFGSNHTHWAFDRAATPTLDHGW